MLKAIRTFSARLITRHRLGPRSLQVRAWAWLAANTDDLAEKVRCLEAIVALDPDLEWAKAALLSIRYRQVQQN